MTNKELLEKYPKVKEVVREWATERMLSSLIDDAIPEDFKEYMKQKGVDDGMLLNIVAMNPHGLFSLFDSHDIYISIWVDGNLTYKYKWRFRIDYFDGVSDNTSVYKSRQDAENAALEKAFEILENGL
jgi:hypothetical protein